MSYVDRIWDKNFLSPKASLSQEEPEGPCPDALAFERWCREWCASLPKNPSLAAIRQKKLLLQDRYWDFYQRADKACREHVSEQYYCIFHVYREWHEKLDMAELSLQPPEDYFRDPQMQRVLAIAAAREELERQREEKKIPALYVGENQE